MATIEQVFDFVVAVVQHHYQPPSGWRLRRAAYEDISKSAILLCLERKDRNERHKVSLPFSSMFGMGGQELYAFVHKQLESLTQQAALTDSELEPGGHPAKSPPVTINGIEVEWIPPFGSEVNPGVCLRRLPERH